jgi:predicted RNA-binding protein
MKNLLTIIGLCFLLSSCSQAQSKVGSEKQVVKEQIEAEFRADEEILKKLVFKPQLSLEEQKYIQTKADQFNGKVKLYAIGYGSKSITYEEREVKNKQMCSWIIDNVNELSKLPVSRERENFIQNDAHI